MEAKKTFYKNYYFRSKLEAKWAVFFDLLKIPYTYEPEPFLCKNKEQYTPDFFLPYAILRDGCDWVEKEDAKMFGEGTLIPRKPGVYLEIKPSNYVTDRLYEERITTAIQPNPLILLCGDPVESCLQIGFSSVNHNVQLSPWWDNNMVFMYCDSCNTYKFEFDEGNYYNCPKCQNDISCHFNEIEQQAVSARNFRFQFYNSVNHE
jgi:hypothetical protein